MPELPEVEITRLGLKSLINYKVSEVVIRNSSLRWPVDRSLHKILIGRKLISLKRRGKYILAEFPNGTLIIHLGMSGHLCIVSKDREIMKHDHVDIVFDNVSHKIVRYNDPRRFGCILWTEKNPLKHKLLDNLGPEPLSSDFDVDYLFQKLRKKTASIKNTIMNSHVVVGVGNIYASEALFHAKIRPQREAHKVSMTEANNLVLAIKETIKNAILKGGSSINNFFDVNGKNGYFQNEHQVYGRKDKPCILCKNPIQQIILGQRSSFYCKKCQQ
ncbi:bifunctional DNA-formamidopyrimidine glycosylase/DNA-(apurinic or apyrimidinic site) lyase [Methylophilaceae bacterium]|jgi:formamidopyrimidine-DNA glycosylase|nr:bifunctional DNA-formamidopyrimidine glycosylase/DNA-(apurinic or apyrimidinic site) lyase [Methylophilaceae bacterium]MDC1173023.1 bifunctional DNA-formamidopyrimidine glycosylase/DNA-(apurinic or apyrimidinic site) lyase [Methylophilaceae bacterium]|tara:strand:- start:5759 stop:6577 length:819 start_codon:yes stop_codon:yes gene_type:complete